MSVEAPRPAGRTPRIFLDTNVLLYAYSITDPDKQARTRELVDSDGAVISTQVLSEFANVVLRKFSMSVSDARQRMVELASRCEVVAVTPATVLEALRIRERYGFGFFDCQIVASALAARTTILYTEDLHDGQTIDDMLRIVSPFATKVREPRGTYRAGRSARGRQLSEPAPRSGSRARQSSVLRK